MAVSNVGDLTKLAKDLEGVFKKHFGQRPGMAIAFTLPKDPKEVHWVTNLSREDGVKVFRGTTAKMVAQTDEDTQ